MLLRICSRIKEAIILIVIRFVMAWKKLLECCILIPMYFKKPQLFRLDVLFVWHFLFKNPYKVSKYYLQIREEKDIHCYGETRASSILTIIRECNISSEDIFYEVGCGRGRASFWFHYLVGCQVLANEQIPLFVSEANKIKKKLGITGMDFLQEDLTLSDYSKASVIYFYGTSVEESKIKKFISKLNVLPKQSKVISVSYPLSDYSRDINFKIIKVFETRFPWGKTNVYLQAKI